jgi:hypothetical protein
MRRPIILLAAGLGFAAAHAQSVPTAPPSDSWSRPAPASTSYRAASAPASSSSAAGSHFKFKDRREPAALPGNAAQEQSGKASVGGMGQMDRNGRPAVNCPDTPMDPACH